MSTRMTAAARSGAGRRPRAAGTEGDTREAILNAARSVFARRGYAGASTREVAEIARVNNAMIYYHFKDKTALYRSVLAQSFDEFDRIWEHPVFDSAAATCRKKIQTYIEGFILFLQDNDDIRRILSMEFASCSGNYRWLADNHFSKGYERLAGLLIEAMRSGELRKADLSLSVSCLIGTVFHTFTVRPLAEHIIGRDLELSARRFGRFVTGMFFDGLAPRGAKRGYVR